MPRTQSGRECLAVYPRQLAFQPRLPLLMGAYGKLTVPIHRETGKFDEAFYGRDGAFRRDKNTHISAAIRLRRNGQVATYFPNPFAKQPIDENASLFSGLRRAPGHFA